MDPHGLYEKNGRSLILSRFSICRIQVLAYVGPAFTGPCLAMNSSQRREHTRPKLPWLRVVHWVIALEVYKLA